MLLDFCFWGLCGLDVNLKGLDHFSKHKLKKWLPLLNQINQLSSKMTFWSDAEMQDRARKLKRRAKEESTLSREKFFCHTSVVKNLHCLFDFNIIFLIEIILPHRNFFINKFSRF